MKKLNIKVLSLFVAAAGMFASCSQEEISKADLFAVGLTGGADSADRRDAFAVSLGLPKKMTPNALLSALNVMMTREEFLKRFQE